MGWLDWLGWPKDPAPEPAFVEPTATKRTGMERTEFHIRRFTMALEQCEKGPEREAELRRNLDYWTAIRDAEMALRS